MEYKIKCKNISSEKIDIIEKNNFITLDIETYIGENNKFIPYSIGFYDRLIYTLSYLTEFKYYNKMLEKCIKHILLLYNKFLFF